LHTFIARFRLLVAQERPALPTALEMATAQVRKTSRRRCADAKVGGIRTGDLNPKRLEEDAPTPKSAEFGLETWWISTSRLYQWTVVNSHEAKGWSEGKTSSGSHGCVYTLNWRFFPLIYPCTGQSRPRGLATFSQVHLVRKFWLGCVFQRIFAV